MRTGQLDPAKHDDGEYDLILNGGGWGHGIGMSQYAARGAALLGCTHEQILKGFFPKATLGSTSVNSSVRVGLFPNTAQAGYVDTINVKNTGGEPLTWKVSPLPEGTSQPPKQPAGVQWTVHWESGGFVLREGSSNSDKIVWPSNGEPVGEWKTALRADLSNTRVALSSKDGNQYARGTLEFLSRGNTSNTGMSVVVDVPTVEQYLYGLAEVPSSWGEDSPAALETQAISGRSFVIPKLGSQRANCQCHVWDSTSDQVYSGWSKEGGSYGSTWVAAVDATKGRVLQWDQRQDGSLDIVPVFYSSSHGGHSSAASDIWNSPPDTNGYLEAVDISRWEQAATENPYHRWSAGFTADELASRFGVDTVTLFEVAERAPGGRPCSQRSPLNPCSNDEHGVVVHGLRGGEAVELSFSSEEIRAKLGILNGLFYVDEITFPYRRLAGDDRIQTAIRLSADGWSDGSDTVVLARQDVAADALTGSALAGTHDAPLLLTEKDQLLPAVADEIQRLEATTVVLLGGTSALSEQVERDIATLGIADVQRVEGPDRHATAADIATKVARGEETTAYLVRLAAPNPAVGWVDALSVAGVAARRAGGEAAWPVLGTDATLPDATRAAIADLGITRVVPVGGPNTIPRAVVDELTELGVEVAKRLAGEDRYGTSRAVAGTDTPTEQSLVIATGENFPDGLAAGPYAARTGGTLLLVPRTTDPAPVWEDDQHPAFVRGFGWEDPSLTAVGGPAAIQNEVVSRVAVALESARPES